MSGRPASLVRGPQAPGWWQLWRAHARQHRLASIGLVLGAAVLALLLGQALHALVSDGGMRPALRLALLGGMVGFAATAFGALPGFWLSRLSQRVEGTALGFAAGMMLAASAFSLVLPGLEAGALVLGSATGGAAIVVIGMAAGGLLMLGLDAFTPHEHDKNGPCGPGHDRCGRVWLFVFAIALHNLPEGMAVGVGFAAADLSVGVPLTVAIALQNIPEGMAVALALRGTSLGAGAAVAIAAATGALEPLGALLGAALSSGMLLAYPIGLGLAAGAMLFVVSHEVIPETHRHGHQTPATFGLLAGFALVMVLDAMLG